MYESAQLALFVIADTRRSRTTSTRYGLSVASPRPPILPKNITSGVCRLLYCVFGLDGAGYHLKEP